MLPWTWTAFAVAALAGMMMFSSKALTYYGNIPFRLKMVCLLLAGINMVMFHWLGVRRLASLGSSAAALDGQDRRRRLACCCGPR